MTELTNTFRTTVTLIIVRVVVVIMIVMILKAAVEMTMLTKIMVMTL